VDKKKRTTTTMGNKGGKQKKLKGSGTNKTAPKTEEVGTCAFSAIKIWNIHAEEEIAQKYSNPGDYYMVFNLDGNEQKTLTETFTTEPEWKDKFTFVGIHSGSKLRVKLQESNGSGPNDFVHLNEFWNLSSLEPGQTATKTLQLEKSLVGDCYKNRAIKISFEYETVGSDKAGAAEKEANLAAKNKFIPDHKLTADDTAFFKAIDNCDIDKVKTLLPKITSINMCRDYRTPLHVCGEKCNKPGGGALAEFLLDNGAMIDAKWVRGGGGMTPLHRAASADNLEVAKVLVSRGADKTVQANSENTFAQMTSNAELKAL